MRHQNVSHRGSMMVLVILVAAVLALAVASILRWSLTERRLNERHALRLEARNAAEAAAEFAFAQVRYRMDNQTSFPTTMLDPDGSDPLEPPPTSLFAGSNVDVNSIKVTGGVVRNVTNDLSGTHFYVDPTDPNNQFDPQKGKRIFRRDVLILAEATVSTSDISAITAYVGQTLSMREAPLFAHAMFFNMDLEISPGSTMEIYGPVHTNGDLWIIGPYNTDSLDFIGPVTCAGGVHYGYLVNPMTASGGTEGYRDGTVRFLDKSGAMISLRDSSTGSWRDHDMGTGTETDATRRAFRTFASNTYNGYLQTSVHGVENYKPVAFADYTPDPTPTDGVDDSVNSGRAIIERPLASTETGYNAQIESQKISRKAGLYIAVNPSSTARTAKKPDGTDVTIPGGQYRAYTADGTEVILPGSTAATAGTAHPTAGGRPIIQIKPDAMTDLRRYTNFNWNSNRSYSNAFDVKSVDLIEVDMTALKMAVDWTVNGESASQIYDYDSSSSDSTYRATSLSSVSLSTANNITNFSSSDWNGCIYIESVDAETRKDSGVRFINGRGRVASTATNSATEGLTIATNDAAYILGDFNCDGTINTTSSSLTNSSRYPENADEVPAAIAADAVTVLSQPTFDSSGTQISGWNDALSGHRRSTSGYTSSWATSSLSSSNQVDGTSSPTQLASDPTDRTSAASGSNYTVKMSAADTEIAAAMIVGMVISNKNGSGTQSGGAHNFPRFLEGWPGTLAIRGSMVALFESRVADEPFSVRYYEPPARFWGFNSILAEGRYPPQTPRVRTYRRVDFTDLSPSEYRSLQDSLPW